MHADTLNQTGDDGCRASYYVTHVYGCALSGGGVCVPERRRLLCEANPSLAMQRAWVEADPGVEADALVRDE